MIHIVIKWFAEQNESWENHPAWLIFAVAFLITCFIAGFYHGLH